MRTSLILLCFIVVLTGASIRVMAQTSSATIVRTYEGSGGMYIVEVRHNPGAQQPVEIQYWDSKSDYELSKTFNSQKGWLYGVGQASGNINEEKAADIKRKARDMAINQILSGLIALPEIAMEIKLGYEKAREYFQSIAEGKKKKILPLLNQVAKQYSYHVRCGDVVTFIVGVGVDTKKLERLRQLDQGKNTEASIAPF